MSNKIPNVEGLINVIKSNMKSDINIEVNKIKNEYENKISILESQINELKSFSNMHMIYIGGYTNATQYEEDIRTYNIVSKHVSSIATWELTLPEGLTLWKDLFVCPMRIYMDNSEHENSITTTVNLSGTKLTIKSSFNEIHTGIRLTPNNNKCDVRVIYLQ